MHGQGGAEVRPGRGGISERGRERAEVMVDGGVIGRAAAHDNMGSGVRAEPLVDPAPLGIRARHREDDGRRGEGFQAVHVVMSSTLKSPSTAAAAAASPRAAKGQALSTGNIGHSGSAGSISIDGSFTPNAASALREVKKQPAASGSPMARPSFQRRSPSRADSSARPTS